MADVNVNFIHPTDGRLLNVTLDDTITAQEAVAELISNEFIRPNSQGYNLAIKGGDMIDHNKSFADAGVSEQNNTNTIRVVPATDAG